MRARWMARVLAVTLAVVGLATVPAGSAGAAAAPSRFVALTPARLLDTRDGTGQSAAGVVPSNGTIRLQVAGHGGVPAAGAVAVVMNVTATGATGPGFVTVWPATEPQPTASNLNIDRQGQTISNLVTVQLGSDGAVNLYAMAATHLVADVAGYFTPSGATAPGRVVPTTPTRVLDTRSGVGAPAALLAAGSTIVVDLASRVPAGTAAAIMNVTATDTTLAGFVTAWPAGLARPLASNLNVEGSGQTIANLVMVPLSADGKVALYSQSPLDLVADLEGYVTGAGAAPSTDGLFTPVVPTRALDTRTSDPLPRLAGGTPATLQLAGRVGLPPTGIAAVLMNVTATAAAGPGFVTVFPGGGGVPLASNLNVSGAGQTIPNLALGSLGAGGSVGLYSQSSTDLVVDVAGWFSGTPASPTAPGLPAITDLTPTRSASSTPCPATSPPIRRSSPPSTMRSTSWPAGSPARPAGTQPRFYAPGGTLAVDTVDLGITKAAIEGAADPLTTLAGRLHALGYGTSGETVVAYVASIGTACGITQDNQGAATTVALWMPACDIYPRADTPSFPYNATYLAAHEMTHAFGAVPACAPHSDGTGHVNDDLATSSTAAAASGTGTTSPSIRATTTTTATAARTASTSPQPVLDVGARPRRSAEVSPRPGRALDEELGISGPQLGVVRLRGGCRESVGEGERELRLDASGVEDAALVGQLGDHYLPHVAHRSGGRIFPGGSSDHIEDFAEVDPADDGPLGFQQPRDRVGGRAAVFEVAQHGPGIEHGRHGSRARSARRWSSRSCVR